MALQDLTQAKDPAGDEAEEDAPQATSFFQWFDVPEDEPATEDEIAEIMREHIWPNPLQLYMGETVRTLASCNGSIVTQTTLLLSVLPSPPCSIQEILCLLTCPMGPLTDSLICMSSCMCGIGWMKGFCLMSQATFIHQPMQQLAYPGRLALWPELKA